MCNHLGYHTPTSRYDRYRKELRFILVCDQCGAILDEVTKVTYAPQFSPFDGGYVFETGGDRRG
jgi:hypothetical protein